MFIFEFEVFLVKKFKVFVFFDGVDFEDIKCFKVV